MKKLLVVSMAILLSVSLSFADEWVPVPMELDVEDHIMYDFDGSTLDIPLTVTGKAGAFWLVIMTHDKGDEIGEVKNGFMDWHYVNKIDTTVYISARTSKEVGSTTLSWDGTNSDGDDVEAGTYDYYIWGYDDVNTRELACSFVQLMQEFRPVMSKMYSFDKDMMPLANPMFFGNPPWYTQYETGGEVYKWVLGGDPEDEEWRQHTTCPIYTTGADANLPGYLTIGYPSLDNENYNTFYQPSVDNDAALFVILKWTFVDDGDAIIDNDWGGWDSDLVFEMPQQAVGPSAHGCGYQGSYTDFNYLYFNANSAPGDISWNYIYCVDFDGELIFEKNHTDWYMPDDPGGAGNGAPYLMDWSQNTPNRWVIAGRSCLIDCVDYTKILEDVDDDEDMLLWRNGNGDFFMDAYFGPDADPAWRCLTGYRTAEDGNEQGSKISLAVDGNDFNVHSVAQYGMANFALSTPDGTGIGYMNFADETVGDQTIRKGGGVLCDNGGKFDGLYWCRASNEAGNMWLWGSANHIGFDSARGVISNEPAPSVEADAAIEAFSLAQNVPNPFNPTTTINFTISEDDFVTLDIYNVAGQKVDTLVNDFKSTGNYSVTWDSAGLSAGVYFYTLKSGDISKTMKMTLLK